MVSHVTQLVIHTLEKLIKWTRQPLFWNTQMRTRDDMMLGQLKGLARGKLAQAGIHSIGDWRRMVAPGVPIPSPQGSYENEEIDNRGS